MKMSVFGFRIHTLKAASFLLLVICSYSSFSQKAKSNKQPVKAKPADNRPPLQKLNSFLYNLEYLCTRYEDSNLKQLLADNLKNNKAFLKEWEIGLNDPQAQIWQTLPLIIKSPYAIDSSNKAKIICEMPFIKDNKKVPGSAGVLQILPKEFLDIENMHDIILSAPDAQSKAIGKVQPGEQYAYFPGGTAYSSAQKKYIPDFYKEESEAGILFHAIVLDSSNHKLGYISDNASYNSLPMMQLQYITGQWKIVKLAHQ